MAVGERILGRGVRCRPCEERSQEQERWRPVTEKDVEGTSVRDKSHGSGKKVNTSKNGSRMCTGNIGIGGGVPLIRKNCSLVSQIRPPPELSSSDWIRLGWRTQGTEQAAERAGREPGQHRPDMPT